jgi:dipeptidyl aminopeptidase/acylaminoacyl peptidase
LTLLSLPAWKLAARIKAGNVVSVPRFSPDGRWMAYSSADGSDELEIFVQPVPPNGRKWQVSAGGAVMPVWSRDGKALYFVSRGEKLMEAIVSRSAGEAFASDQPRPLFGVALREAARSFAQYDVFPDGTFQLNQIPATATTSIAVVIHWKDALGQ